jgi:protein phosphatase
MHARDHLANIDPAADSSPLPKSSESWSVSEDWKPGIAFADLTDVGMRRANNQDSHVSIPAKNEDRFWQRGHLFIVADGMGAHAAGELASRMATELIALNYFRNTTADVIDALRTAVHESNHEIYQRGQQNPEFHNMGTTASTLAIVPEGAIVAHVGDSRIYRLRRGVFEQLTFDHSLVWEMEASGQVAPNSALSQAIPKNVITRSLGPNAQVAVDIEGPFKLEKDDRFLLCSDGLSGQVDDTEMATLVDCLPEELAARVLVDLANLRGGPDNSTVIIVRVEDGPGTDSAGGPPRRSAAKATIPPLLLGATIIGFVLALIMAATQNWGPMVVCIILGMVGVGFCVFQHLTNRKKIDPNKPLPKISGGKGPYRRYSAAASQELYQRLGETVGKLREAATTNNWLMDWQKIDQLQAQGIAALKSKHPKEAIRLQAEAIIETMQQLREQHNRAANETAIDY